MAYRVYALERVTNAKSGPPCFFISTVAFLILFLLSASSLAAIYYVDATDGNDTNNGISGSTAWKTIAKVNNSSFSPGDQILFKNGETWREQLTVPSSGSAGSPITFGAYGSGAQPIIDGSNSLTGIWTQTQITNTWEIALTTQPNIILFGGTVGTVKTALADLSVDLDWCWESNVLYVRSATNPGTRFAAIVAGARDSCVDTASKAYLLIEGLSLQKSNSTYKGGVIISGGNNVIIQNCHSSYNAGAGVILYSNDSGGGSHLVTNNELDHSSWGFATYQYNGAGPGTETVISHNNIHDINYISPGNTYPEAVHFYGNYLIAEYNTLTNNGNAMADCIGIHIYNGHSEPWGQNNIVRYNSVSGQISWNAGDGSAFEAENAKNNQIYYNVFFGNYGPCIDFLEVSKTQVYNNTCYDNMLNSNYPQSNKSEVTLTCPNYHGTTDIILKNNLVYSTRSYSYAVYVDSFTAANSLIITNNDWYGSGQANWYWWGNAAGSNLATWNALAAGRIDLNSDPIFVSATDFHLQPSSPCVDSGTDVGLTQDFQGLKVPLGSAPDIGAFEYQPASSMQTPSGLRILAR